MSKLMFNPLHSLFHVCGIAPFNQSFDKVLSVAVLAVISCLAVHTALTVSEWPNSMHETLLVASVVIVYTGTIVYLMYNLFNKKSYIELMQTLEIADEELRQVDAAPHRYVWVQQVIMAVLLAANAIHELISISRRIGIRLVRDVVAGILLEAGLAQHLVLVHLIHCEFTALNGYLRRVAERVTETPVAVVSNQLETVFRVHSSLHLVVADLNSHSFFYNLTKVAASMIFCVYFMYDYLKTISDPDNHLNLRQFTIFLMELTGFIAQTTMCHACAKEANKTVIMAHHILNKDTPYRLWKEVGFFSLLCVDNKVHFTVGGVFTLDRVLITKASITALSYLIIAVQLKDVQLFGNVSPELAQGGNVYLNYTETTLVDNVTILSNFNDF